MASARLRSRESRTMWAWVCRPRTWQSPRDEVTFEEGNIILEVNGNRGPWVSERA